MGKCSSTDTVRGGNVSDISQKTAREPQKFESRVTEPQKLVSKITETQKFDPRIKKLDSRGSLIISCYRCGKKFLGDFIVCDECKKVKIQEEFRPTRRLCRSKKVGSSSQVSSKNAASEPSSESGTIMGLPNPSVFSSESVSHAVAMGIM